MSEAMTELVDWIRSKLPGYDGYANIEKRKISSELVRDKIYRHLRDASININRVLDSALNQSDTDACNQLEKTRAEIDILRDKIKKADDGRPPATTKANKKSVFVRPEDIKGKRKKSPSLTREITVIDFDKVIHCDEIMLRACEDIKNISDQLVLGSYDDEKLRSCTITILTKVLDIDEAFQKRKDILTGVSVVIH